MGSQEINYDSPRGGVSVITEKGEITTSYLLVQRAQPTDSGHYTCHPSNANTETVLVHILNGKRLFSFFTSHTFYTHTPIQYPHQHFVACLISLMPYRLVILHTRVLVIVHYKADVVILVIFF